jgi:hypothetical protein
MGGKLDERTFRTVDEELSKAESSQVGTKDTNSGGHILEKFKK